MTRARAAITAKPPFPSRASRCPEAAGGVIIRPVRRFLFLVPLLIACESPQWEVVHHDLPGALLSVWGTSASDVWAVGGDVGSGPEVLHYDGTAWERIDTGHTGALWWVFGFEGGPVYVGGEGGAILRYEDGAFTPMTTPGTNTVFGIWGASPDDLWAVGGASDATGGFAWRLEGDAWVEEPTLPADVPSSAAIWKVFGRSADDVWLVGSNGVSLYWDGSTLTRGETGVGSSLFTVSANERRFTAVGGLGNGIIVEDEGSGWHNVTPDNALAGLSGVVLGAGDTGFAVGNYGQILARDSNGWHAEETTLDVVQNLHAVWLDPDGGAWAVGGQTFSFPLTDGVLIHRGGPISAELR